MKIIRPLKYVITAAAVCILCFSGSGQYMCAVFAVTPENDIVELPEQPEGYDESAVSCAARLRKYFVVISGRTCENGHLDFLKGPKDFSAQNIGDCINERIQELFAIKLPGNRSP